MNDYLNNAHDYTVNHLTVKPDKDEFNIGGT
jgi:hypothetical protein